MSRVVSCRLSEDDPDDAAALAALDRFIADGHTIKDIMLWALLSAGGNQPIQRPDPSVAIDTLLEVRDTLAGAAQELATTVSASQRVINANADGLAEIAQETRAALAEARELIAALRSAAPMPSAAPAQGGEQAPISDALRMAVRRAAKPGRRLE